MATNRLETLQAMVSQNPQDTFARYGLAMECMNSGDSAAANDHFRTLLERSADYVPAYLIYAQMLSRESRTQEARNVLAVGIAAAQRKGDQHARSEMESLLNDLS